ncbi:unnamed protein product [Euphydryas editha]|uniref:Mos1 transposase HTH domain-containing protein n=1 Tax=Euphydryas editha TaxID=104508 RepID=A0AAU9TLR3_EUPED|nr:unnamed protein product [Euphydryas editha]
MGDFVEQRTCIKFCLRNKYSHADTLKMLGKAFGDQTMAQKNLYKWYNEFKAGRERIDKPRSGRPSTSTDVLQLETLLIVLEYNLPQFKLI